MSENNSGGLNDPSRSNTGSVGAGGVNSGSNSSNQGSNYGSQFGGTPNKNSAGQTQPYGTTPYPVRPADQTLQDRMYGTPATGMPSSNVGGRPGSSGTGSSVQTPAPPAPKPVPVKPIPKPIVTIKAPVPAKPVPGKKYPGIGGTTGAGAESEYDKTNWTGVGSSGPLGPGSAVGLPGSTSGLPGRGPVNPGMGGTTPGGSGQGPIGGGQGTVGAGGGTEGLGGGRGYAGGGGFGGRGRNGAIVSGNYVEAPGGAQVDPMTGKHGLKHRQQVENQVRRVFGAKPDGAAGGSRPMQGYAGGGASNLPRYGPGSPGSWTPAGRARQVAQQAQPRYLTGSDASPSSFPRKPNPNYVPPGQPGGQGQGGKGSWEPTGQGRDPGGNPRNDYF